MVIDPRETWGDWLKRQANFDEPPMIDRESLPQENQPHKSLFGRLENVREGINPYPPGHKWNKSKTMKTHPIRNLEANEEEKENHSLEDGTIEADQIGKEEEKNNYKENCDPSVRSSLEM